MSTPTRFDDAIVTAVLAHMNDDHADDCLEIVQAYGQPGATAARMVDLDSEVGVYAATVEGAEVEVRIAWPSGAISERPEIRVAVVEVHAEALRRLGRGPDSRPTP